MAVQFRDYYEVLGVPKTAGDDEIRKAFRKLARQHHPDMVKASEKKSAEEKFKEINEAYEVLGDPEKRKKYDELGANWDKAGGFQPPPGWEQQGGGFPGGGGFEYHFGGTGFSDFFEAFFSGGNKRGRGAAHGFGVNEEDVEQRSRDIEADILVTIEEALHGSQRRVSFRRKKNGKVETFNVRIPAGVYEGQRIRLAGAAGHGADVFLLVKFQQHPEFRIENSDLVHEVPLAPWQAVLGCEVSMPTPEGPVKLKIPAGTQSHRRFRLRGRGLPREGGERGDLYAVIDVVLPKTLTARQRELWEELARAGGE